MIRNFLLAVSLALVAGGGSACAREVVTFGYEFGRNDSDVWIGRVDKNGEADISGYKGPGGDVVVPSTIDGYPVVHVNLSRVVSEITSLSVPGRVRNFSGVSSPSLVNLKIDDGVQLMETPFVGGGANFNHCTSLPSVSIPDSVKRLGAGAFSRLEALTKVSIGKGLTNIPPAAFYGTGIKELTIPDNIKLIETAAFKECKDLASVVIPGSVEIIQDSAFADCSGLVSVTIEDGVQFIDSFAFQNCVNLETIVVPESVQTIHSDAFNNCPKLKNVILPKRFLNYATLHHILGLAPQLAESLSGEIQSKD